MIEKSQKRSGVRFYKKLNLENQLDWRRENDVCGSVVNAALAWWSLWDQLTYRPYIQRL